MRITIPVFRCELENQKLPHELAYGSFPVHKLFNRFFSSNSVTLDTINAQDADGAWLVTLTVGMGATYLLYESMNYRGISAYLVNSLTVDSIILYTGHLGPCRRMTDINIKKT